jgi:hypothetical protein
MPNDTANGGTENGETPPNYTNDKPPLYTEPTWLKMLPCLSAVALCVAIMGIAESICYLVYYLSFNLLLPARAVYVPIIGGGPLQMILNSLAFTCSQLGYPNRDRRLLFFSAVFLTFSCICGLAIPTTSLVMNNFASSDSDYLAEALLTIPQPVLKAYATQYESCSYQNLTETLRGIVPQYLDKTCPYSSNVCNIPIRVCSTAYKSSCFDISTTLSVQGPCNTVDRVLYQIRYDWEKFGKVVDMFAIGICGIWFLIVAFATFCR